MSQSPAEIRSRVRTVRKSLNSVIAQETSRRTCQALLNAVPAERWKGMTVALYHPMLEELSPEHLAATWKSSGARLFYPRVVDRSGRLMEFAEMTDGGTWVKGIYDITEPGPEHPAAAIDNLDLIILPGVAFGESGERLGTGAGFYDRALAGVMRPLRVALAFDFQVFPSLPQEEWDQQVDWVLTERQDLRNSRVAEWLNRRKQP